MASVFVLPDRVDIHLSAAEKALAFHRGDISIARENIRSATVTEDPWIWVRGIRTLGNAIPLVLAVGTWKFHGGTDFLIIKRTRPSVVLDLVDETYSRVVVTTQHAAELIAALQIGNETATIPIVPVSTVADARSAESSDDLASPGVEPGVETGGTPTVSRDR